MEIIKNELVEKITNKKALEYVLKTYDIPAQYAEKLESMVVQLEKRSSAERKPSPRQVENEKLMGEILNAMLPDHLYSVGEMIKEYTFFPIDITPQRVSALMTKLVENGKVTRIVEKRKVYFQLIAE